jgi:hypothetical protein
MPEIVGDGGNASARAVSALLFMTSAMTTLDAYSTLNSSPWTSENFGADPAKAKSSREYVRHAIVFSTAYAVAAALIAENWWPLLGSAVSNGYLYWLYERALKRGAEVGSSNWGQSAPIKSAMSWKAAH